MFVHHSKWIILLPVEIIEIKDGEFKKVQGINYIFKGIPAVKD